MTHIFMYPRVAQIAPRAHSVSASQLATRPRPDASGLPHGSTAAGAAAGRAPAVPSFTTSS
jgi:hypothetical protein